MILTDSTRGKDTEIKQEEVKIPEAVHSQDARGERLEGNKPVSHLAAESLAPHELNSE